MSKSMPLIERQLHSILHRAFVEARSCARCGRLEQVLDLADYFEAIALEMNHLDAEALERIRRMLQGYQAKYASMASNYLWILELTEEQYDNAFEPRPWDDAAMSSA